MRILYITKITSPLQNYENAFDQNQSTLMRSICIQLLTATKDVLGNITSIPHINCIL